MDDSGDPGTVFAVLNAFMRVHRHPEDGADAACVSCHRSFVAEDIIHPSVAGTRCDACNNAETVAAIKGFAAEMEILGASFVDENAPDGRMERMMAAVGGIESTGSWRETGTALVERAKAQDDPELALLGAVMLMSARNERPKGESVMANPKERHPAMAKMLALVAELKCPACGLSANTMSDDCKVCYLLKVAWNEAVDEIQGVERHCFGPVTHGPDPCDR